MPERQNFYQLLQVDPQAEVTIIRYAYRHLVAKYHPGNNQTGSKEMFDKITKAWTVLSDSDRRAEYSNTQLKNTQKKRNLYILLQVDPEAETVIIRFAYRYLAKKYHPDSERGDADIFRLLTDAWKILCDDERRAAYDKRSTDDDEPEQTIRQQRFSWTRDELQIAILQVLLAASQKRSGGRVTKNMLMDILSPSSLEFELALEWLRQSDLVDCDGADFVINENGVQYLHKHLR
jgi:DnaJ-class molecular chaperone